MKLLAPLALVLSTASAVLVQLNGPDEGAVQKNVPGNNKIFVFGPPTLPSYTSAFVVSGNHECRAYNDTKGKRQVGGVFTATKSTALHGTIRSLRVNLLFSFRKFYCLAA